MKLGDAHAWKEEEAEGRMLGGHGGGEQQGHVSPPFSSSPHTGRALVLPSLVPNRLPPHGKGELEGQMRDLGYIPKLTF